MAGSARSRSNTALSAGSAASRTSAVPAAKVICSTVGRARECMPILDHRPPRATTAAPTRGASPRSRPHFTFRMQALRTATSSLRQGYASMAVGSAGCVLSRAHAWRFIECDHLRSPTDIAIVNPATSAPTPIETPFGSQSDCTSHLAVRFAEALQDAVFARQNPRCAMTFANGDRRLAETAKSYRPSVRFVRRTVRFVRRSLTKA